MIKNFVLLLHQRKYEFLLVALVLHLFYAVVLTDLVFYERVIWPLNMLLLGLFSVGIFSGRGTIQKLIKNLLAAIVVILPAILVFFGPGNDLMIIINVTHIAFYTVIFIEILRYLIKPSYISTDIVSASVCGYLLLIEIGTFSMQYIYYDLPGSFKGIDVTNHSTVFLDMVYFCSITLTSIGFGDITPANHTAKLATSILGIAGQFYSVVLVGIMISKYTSSENNK